MWLLYVFLDFCYLFLMFCFFFFKQKTAYEIGVRLVGSEMCIRDRVDVAADIPARRVADLPVELDGAVGRSIRAAEAALATRLVGRYRSALAARTSGVIVDGIDHELVRRVAGWELKESSEQGGAENVFAMVRRIGQAKAGLAADYAAQHARNVGKVVFFAKHVDVMDQAEQTLSLIHISE